MDEIRIYRSVGGTYNADGNREVELCHRLALASSFHYLAESESLLGVEDWTESNLQIDHSILRSIFCNLIHSTGNRILEIKRGGKKDNGGKEKRRD